MDQPDDADIIARCVTALRRAREADGAAFDAAVGEVVADLNRLPRARPVRSVLAADLIRLLLGRFPQGDAKRLRRLDALVEMAEEHPPDDANWPRTRAVARIMAVLRAAAEHELTDPRAALRDVGWIAAEFPDDRGIQGLHQSARAALGLVAGLQRNDANAMPAMLRDLDGMRELAGEHAQLRQMLDLVVDMSGAFQAHQGGDSAAALKRLDEVRARTDRLPEGDIVREAMADVSTATEALRPLLVDPGAGGHPQLSGEQLAALRQLTERPDSTDAERALYLVAVGGAALRGGAETDLVRISAAVDDLRRAVELTDVRHPERPFNLASLALALWHRNQVGGATADLDEAIGLLEQARSAAGGPGHPHWTFINGMLAEVRRRRGDNAPSRRVALEGLRGYAWSVLLQPDPASARVAARDAADDAVDVAIGCLADHNPADALRALDAGRALMLYAATELRDPTTRLTAAGHAELAQRWSAEAARPSAELREAVLQVLFQEAGLLDPPDLNEIQAALRTLDVEALVYLVPARPPRPGWAVIAPVAGPPRYMALAHLVVDDGLEVERYLDTLANRSAALVDPLPGRTRDLGADGRDPFVDSVDAMCGWAWKAAIGPLVKPHLDERPAGSPVPRLVLVPMGDLARIPWSAARDPDGVYAIERVAISQTASARMLCESAAAVPVPLTSAGLVVGDPDTAGRAVDLTSARIEAYAIQQVLYPGAKYVGRRPDGTVSRSGAGSPDDVRGWLAGGPEAGTMLHLASHGVVETAPHAASSYLVLAGGKELTAADLLDSARPLALAVLAACHSGRSMHGYDEAYSLGTVLLAAGARSVLSAQWSVPDQATSLLMYMFHHFLRTEHRPVWDALRRAQLWMLDGDREPPVTLPRQLRRTLDETDPARVVAWAGFVHWGQ
jgi:hypothetical protein